MSDSGSPILGFEFEFNLPPTPRRSSIMAMQNNSQNDVNAPSQVTTPTYINMNRLTHLPNDIPLFKGTVDNKYTDPKIGSWLYELEQYFGRENITADTTKIREARRFVHQKEGSARYMFEHKSCFKNNSDWETFKDDCMTVFRDTRTWQPHPTLFALFHLVWDESEDYHRFVARVGEMVSVSSQALKSKYNYVLPEVVKKLIESVVLWGSLPETHKKKFSDSLQADMNIDKALEKTRDKCGEIEAGRKSKPAPLCAVQAVKPETNQAFTNVRHCFNCDKPGHFVKECPLNYCVKCKTGASHPFNARCNRGYGYGYTESPKGSREMSRGTNLRNRPQGPQAYPMRVSPQMKPQSQSRPQQRYGQPNSNGFSPVQPPVRHQTSGQYPKQGQPSVRPKTQGRQSKTYYSPQGRLVKLVEVVDSTEDPKVNLPPEDDPPEGAEVTWEEYVPAEYEDENFLEYHGEAALY